LDVFVESAKILSLAANGASHSRLVSASHLLKHDEIRWLLKMLVDKRLLEVDSQSNYWITVDGAKFLEIQFNMERILQAQKSLV
jgi:predicted transcriptional regulator